MFAVPHILLRKRISWFDNIAPNVLLIEPFLKNRDAIRWIKDLAAEFRRSWGKCQFSSSECNAVKRHAHATSTSNTLEHELEHAPDNRSPLGPVPTPGVTSNGVYRCLMNGGTYPT